MKSKIEVITLGCRVNQAESEAIAATLRKKGGDGIAIGEIDEVCVINTCAVTGKAAMQSRQAIRKAIRTHPNAVIIATGCYAQSDPEAIGKIEGVDYVVGHSDKHRIPQLIKGTERRPASEPIILHHDIRQQRRFEQMPMPAIGSRTRPFLKVQDGCDDFCSYCIVPYTRGRSRSLPSDDVLFELAQLKSSGAREVVLTGIHLGRYGLDLSPSDTLLNLLFRIKQAGIVDRIRLSSIEPTELDNNLLNFIVENPWICRHLHIPLQSGDGDILKKMHRPYTPETFATLVETVHRLLPAAAIGADVLVGFPGETDKAFGNTYELIRTLPISYLHIFPFSPRPPAPAARFPNPVPPHIIKSRCAALDRLGKDKKKAFYAQFSGKALDVIIEERQGDASVKLKGISDNYVPVFTDGADEIISARIRCRIRTPMGHHGVVGTIIGPE